jgi:hypothetical protein
MKEHAPNWVPPFDRGRVEGRTKDENARHREIQRKLGELTERVNRLTMVETPTSTGTHTSFRSESELTDADKLEVQRLDACIGEVQNHLRIEGEIRRSDATTEEIHQRVSSIYDKIEQQLAEVAPRT